VAPSLTPTAPPQKKLSLCTVKPNANDVGLKTIQMQEGDAFETALTREGLDDKYESTLVDFLRANRDIFAWKLEDMLGVPKVLIEHCLKVDLKAISKKQQLCWFTTDKREAI
jgi:hypothetical protein